MILNQELINVYIDYDIIENEIVIINNNLKYIYDTYNNIVNINNINRKNLLFNLENNFQCYTIQQSFSIILKLSIKLNELKEKYNLLCKLFSYKTNPLESEEFNITLSPLINKWLTEIKTLSISSAEGYVLKNGFRFLNNLMVIKTPKSIKNSKSLIHEYFIGLHLNNLRKNIPNFMYTYALFNCNIIDIDIVKNTVQSSKFLNICEIDSNKTTYLLLEFIKGYTLTDYLKNDYLNLNMNFLISTISQVLCSLQIAYDTYGYCHNDLHASNIVIRELPDKKYIKYYIPSRNKTYHILTDNIATIIDYGYNSLEFNNLKYKTTFFIDKNQKIVNWSLNKYKTPGIDLAKFFIHVYNILKIRSSNYNFNVKTLLECINNTFSIDFGVNNLFSPGNHNGYYPIVYDIKLHDINPFDFLDKFIDRLNGFNINYNDIIYRNTNPPLGYIVLNDPIYCKSSDISESLNILTDIKKDDKCGSNNWKSLKDWKYENGDIGNWVDCGKNTEHLIENMYINTSIYPEGLTLYNGNSKIVELNLEFESINESNSTVLFFGDYNEALNESKNTNCGNNCISTYKLKYDIEFFNLYDKKNIIYLLYGNILDTNDKIELCNLFFIDFNSIPSNKEEFVYKSDKINKLNHLSKFIYKLLEHLYKFNIYGIIHKYNYDNTYKYQIIIYNNVTNPFVYRDLSNILDWQYFDNRRLFGEIGNFIKDFKKYKLTSKSQGDPYQLSVWTSLYIQSQFVENTYLTQYININYFNVAIAAGFLHCIGYGGSLVYNTSITYTDALKNASYYLLDDSNTSHKKYLYNLGDEVKELDIRRVLRDMNISNDNEMKLVIFLIISIKTTIDTLHNLIKVNLENISDYNDITLNYISTLLDNLFLLDITFDTLDTNTKNIYKNYFMLTILISICSIMGKFVYIDNDKFVILQKSLQKDSSIITHDLNSYIITLPFIKNQPRLYKGINDNKSYLIKIEKSSKILINFINNYIK